MRTLLVCAMMLIACIMSGCMVVTLQPLYTSETLTFDPALIGAWQDKEADTTYTFSDDGEGGYKLSVATTVPVPDGTTSTSISAFIFHLVKLGDHLFGDMYPDLSDKGIQGGYAEWNLAPVHNIFLNESIQPTLRYRVLHPDWLRTFLEANPQAIAHGEIDLGPDSLESLPALTASTAELQAFFLAHVDTPDAYGEPAELVPLTPASHSLP